MTEPTPTSGPWRVCQDGECKCGMIWAADGETLVAVAQGPMHLDDMDPDSLPDRETQIVNAKLLASAWTMQAEIDRLESLHVPLAKQRLDAAEQRIRELEAQVENLIRLNQENVDIGVRYMRSGDDALGVASLAIDVIGRHEKKIKELEAQAAIPADAYNELRIALNEKEEADGRASTVHARAWLRAQQRGRVDGDILSKKEQGDGERG